MLVIKAMYQDIAPSEVVYESRRLSDPSSNSSPTAAAPGVQAGEIFS